MKVWVVMALLLVLMSCVNLTDEQGHQLQIERARGTELSVGRMEDFTTSQTLHALVKGSIYETGEHVSVFGTCLNDSDDGFPGSFGTLAAWYPNGTQFFNNVSMVQMQVGYFVYEGNMSAVQGTYLTEMTCHVTGSTQIAKATGEWQNPFWVRRIALLNDSLTNVSNAVTNISTQVNGLNTTLNALNTSINNGFNNMTQNFNITWQKIDSINVSINSTFTNITAQLLYVASVANHSVDRNDSYLAQLLQQIAATVGTPVTHNLTVTTTIDPSPPQYFKDLTYTSVARNEYNVSVGEPLVDCVISTSNNPPTVNALMTYHEDSNHKTFTYKEKVTTLSPITYNVTCFYN